MVGCGLRALRSRKRGSELPEPGKCWTDDKSGRKQASPSAKSTTSAPVEKGPGQGTKTPTKAGVTREELVALIMGGIFVLETASVILQVASFKLTGKRIFRMAPIHHHFELKGWAEPKVIVRFWIISLLLVLAGLATLKLR